MIHIHLRMICATALFDPRSKLLSLKDSCCFAEKFLVDRSGKCFSVRVLQQQAAWTSTIYRSSNHIPVPHKAVAEVSKRLFRHMFHFQVAKSCEIIHITSYHTSTRVLITFRTFSRLNDPTYPSHL